MIKTNNGHAALDGVKRRPKRNNSSTFLYGLSKRKLLSFLYLILFANAAFTQTTQLKTWIVGDKQFTFPSYPASDPVEETRQFDSVPNLYGIPSVGPVNSATDEAGNVLFYVRHHRLWDSWDQQVNIPFMHRATASPGSYNNQGDVAIVPVIEPANSCFKRYYVIYSRLENYVNLYMTMVTVNLNTKVVTSEFLKHNGVDFKYTRGTPQLFNNGQFLRTNGLAVTPEKNGKRYVYYVACDGVYKLTLVTPSVSYPDGVIGNVKMNITTPGVKFWASQASLSMDATKLTWGVNPDEIPTSTPVTGSSYYVMGLDSNGDWDNSMQTFNLPSTLTGSSLYGCRGVVFNNDASKLFVSTGGVGYGVYAIDIATGAYRLLPASQLAGVSQLRIGNNGLLYCLEEKALKSYNPATELLVTIDSVDTHYPYDSIQFLPNIIYNEKKSSVAQLGIPMKVETTTTFDGNIVGDMKIDKALTVSTFGTTLTIKNMTMEFAEGAILTLVQGTNLVLENCTLKGISLEGCPAYNKRMWKGIVGYTSGYPIDISINQANTGPVLIRDAETGIGLYGPDARIYFLQHSTFIANGTHIGLNNGAKMEQFESVDFIGDESLIDQNTYVGSYNGYPDSLKRTRHAMWFNNTNVYIGSNNTFTGGQTGVYAINPTGGGINGATFTWQKSSGVFVSNINTANNDFNISDNYFGYTNNGVRLINTGAKTLYINRNTFDHVSYNGIEAYNNKSCNFYIGYDVGNLHNPNNKNTFTNSGAAAIYLHNNSDPDSTQIYVMHNVITSSAPASHGIIISESSGGSRKYYTLRIDRNTINNTARGIQLVNVVGGNFLNPTRKYLGSYNVFHVRDNTINLDPTPGSQGITIGNSSRNSYIDNTINGNKYGKGGNLVNSFATLYHGNESNTGYGLMAQGNMVHSNYYCNTFRKANFGMYLSNHILRPNLSQTHGDAFTDARDNDFFTRASSKPFYNICLDASSQLWNQWKFSGAYGIPGIVNLTGGSTAIFAGYEDNNCITPYPSDTTGTDPEPRVQADVTGPLPIFWNEYKNHQGFKMGQDSIGSSDSNIVRLIDAEDLIAEGHFTAALTRINSIVITPSAPDELIMSDYKLLYQTYIAYRLQDTIGRTMNDSMVAILTAIAEKNPVTTSPASHSAQAILWHERMLTFDHTPVPALVLTGFVSSNCALPDMESIPAFLVDENGQIADGPVYTDAEGQFAFDGGIISSYSTDYNPYKIRMILTDGTILETGAATVAELALASDHEMDCGNAIAPLVISGLIHPDGCPSQITSNIMAYLLKQNDEVVEGPVMVNSAGTFSFDPMLTALHHNNDLYKIKLVFANATTATTNPETIAELAAGSVHEFNCPDEPPIILPKKGNEKEPVKYKEEVNEFEKQVPFSISPNPSNGIFTIKGAASGATATLTNLLGQIIIKDLPLTNGLVDASRIKAGVYLLTVTDKHNTYVQKINIIK